MWADALDLMMARVAASGVDLRAIAAISGSAQQHGSVYLNAARARSLASLDARTPLRRSTAKHASRARSSPIWMDSSTRTNARRSRQRSAASCCWPRAPARARSSASPDRRSGSSSSARQRPTQHTDRIHLVSSFLASLLAGRPRAARSGRRLGHEPDGSGARGTGGLRRSRRRRRSCGASFRRSSRRGAASARSRHIGRFATVFRPRR